MRELIRSKEKGGKELVLKKAYSLLKKYSLIVTKLREMNITQSSKVVGDIGEYIAIHKLGLTPVSNPTNKGYDATKNGKRYEIKARKATPWNKPTKFSVSKRKLKSAHVDFLVYVEFDENWNLATLLRIPRSKFLKLDFDKDLSINATLKKRYNYLNKVKNKGG